MQSMQSNQSKKAGATEELLAIAAKHVYPNNKPAKIVLARGQGSRLFDVEGRRFLDLAAGVAVCSLGHAHPKLTATIAAQAGRLMHVSNYFYNEENILLASELCELCEKEGLTRALLCNSGTEANEAMFKAVRRHFYVKGDKRSRIISFHNSFHGRTMGSLAMTGTPKYREGFGRIEGITHVTYGDLDAVAAEMGSDVAAVIVEAVQGEGGVIPAPLGFLEGLRALCNQHGALLVFDEVQTGIGRLGRWFGFQRSGSFAGVRPDAISLAKGLGGGFPIGAMVTSEELGSALPPGTHGSTFGGNPLACAAARTVLRVMEAEDIVPNVERKGQLLSAMLARVARELPNVCEGQRGEGLLRGLILRPGFVARDILPKLVDAGVLLLAAGERVLRFAPPLIITDAELEEGVAIVRKVLEELPAHSS
ncbi:MAG: acetylornithine/succinylornithine family transaminase [Polyangiaceae bacterium]|nr:acetylornithine/succinylornithine family transaminase [Polyangiaceae bacterium]